MTTPRAGNAPPEAGAAVWRARSRDRSLASAYERVDGQAKRLVRTAQALFNEGADITVPAVVARADMSARSFYRHFSSRDELLLAVVEEETAIGATVMQRLIAGHADPADRLRAFVVEYFALPNRYRTPEIRRARITENHRLHAMFPERASETGAPLRRLLQGIVEDLVAGGQVDDAHPQITAQALLHLLGGLIVDAWLTDDPAVRDAFAQHALTLCERALSL